MPGQIGSPVKSWRLWELDSNSPHGSCKIDEDILTTGEVPMQMDFETIDSFLFLKQKTVETG